MKYQAHAVNIRGICVDPMKQHGFPYTHTYEELFISWS
jgi:hypothetical protein